MTFASDRELAPPFISSIPTPTLEHTNRVFTRTSYSAPLRNHDPELQPPHRTPTLHRFASALDHHPPAALSTLHAGPSTNHCFHRFASVLDHQDPFLTLGAQPSSPSTDLHSFVHRSALDHHHPQQRLHIRPSPTIVFIVLLLFSTTTIQDRQQSEHSGPSPTNHHQTK